MLPLLLAAALAALLLAGYAKDWRRLGGRPRLGTPAGPPAAAPLLSVLIPARNEERSIGRCVAGALGQRYPQLEVIVLDDGSTDGTAAALAAFAGDGRLRVLRGRPLPPGWVGKCNACQQLGEAAAGEWLLFLDADTAPGPDLAAALLAHGGRRGLDVVSVFPFQELGTFWERAVLPPFLSLIAAIFPHEPMERPDGPPGAAMAFGPCLLVRRDAYRAVGGHGAVRDEVLEDVMLAQALRAAGFRVGVAEGPEQLRVRMYRSGGEVVAGLAKNAAAGQRSGGARSWWVMARETVLAFGPLWLLAGGAALLAGDAQGAGWAVAALGGLSLAAALGLWAARYRRIAGLGPIHAPLWPLGLLAYMLIAALGILRVWSGRGVVWKGRTYSG